MGLKKLLFLKNAVILTGTALLLRAVGMFFRVYIAGQVGDEGMGLYQLIFTLYNLAITLATSGVTVATTRLAADWLARDRGAPRTLCRRLIFYAFCLGGAAGLLQFFLARPASTLWLGDARAALSLRILAPSLPFMAVGATLRGYFMARRNVSSSSRAQIFEQAVRIGVVALLIGKALPYGIETACAAIVLGNTVSEALSCLYMVISWRRDLKRFAPGEKQKPQHLLRDYGGIVAPITATRGIGSLLVTVENVLVPGCLATFLGARETALAQFGQLKGMAMPVLFFPFSFLSTLSTLLLPEIAEAHSAGKKDRLQALICRTVLITVTLSVLMGGLFRAFAAELGETLYHSSEIGFYIGVLGPVMPFMYLESMVDGILKGLGEQLSTFKYSVCDSVLRILLVLALVPRLGMQGFLFVMLFSNIFTGFLNLHRLIRVTGVRVQWMRWVVKPLFSVGAAWAAYYFAFAVWAAPLLPPLAAFLCGAALMALVYFLFLWLTGCVSPQDFSGMKKSPKSGKA